MQTNSGSASSADLKVVDRVYRSIKHLVINYDIMPGQQIHIEDLSKSLNASVTPVREALNRLLNDGLITRKSGRGFHNRDIDIEELTDLFQLRGSLAISAFHFILRTDLKKMVPDILSEVDRIDDLDVKCQIPICASMISAVGNREMIRIYNSVIDKIYFVWKIYSNSPGGSRDIEAYRRDLRDFLLKGDLNGCIDVIDSNIKIQVSSLDENIKKGLGILFSQKPVREGFPRTPSTILGC